MKKIFFYFFILLNLFQHNVVNAQVQIGQDIDGEAASDGSGWSVSMPDWKTLAIGARTNDGNGLNAGHVRIYSWDGGVWVQKGDDIDGEVAGDQSGYSISMPDSNTVAIGAIFNAGNGQESGHVRIYSWNGSVWIQKGNDIDGEAGLDNSGYSISMPNANTVAIGAPGNGSENNGHVRIYVWNGTAWVQKGDDIDGEAAYDRFGISVFMPNENTVAAGADYNDGINGNDSGHVRIYEWNGTAWAQKGDDIDGESSLDNSGSSISMPDENTISIGAYRNSGNGTTAGHVRVYFWNGSSWLQKGTDIDGEAANDNSGTSVSMPDANTVAIGAPYNDGNGANSGQVRVYSWDGTDWLQKGFDIDGEAEFNLSGRSVSMPDTNTIAIGAFGIGSGHVRVYKFNGVVGYVYNDINENCLRETEAGLNKRKAILQPGDIIVETNSYGYWYLDSLPAGTYTITVDTTGKWRPTCDVTQTFTVTDPNALTQAPSFGLVSTEPCSEPNVSINMPRMRPGFSGQKVYVQACNEYIATGALIDGYVDVALDELITVDAASMSYTALGDNTFRFDVGTLNPGQCVSFDMSTTVSTSAVLGQTLCVEANLFPVESCVLDTVPTPTPPDFTPCTLPWDKSSILVEGACVDGEIIFTITNTGDTGDGDMDCFSPIRLYIDGEYIWLDSIQLTGGETFTYTFAGDGRTWRLEVDQHPLHPGNSHPNATVELCGDPNNWTPDLVNTLPHDDEDPIKDIYCGIVTGSYDPNDKTGYPLGVGDDHLIEPNRKMDYVIRFQNTGTDTAFTVKILDTLDTDLDIFSVRSGVSSHNYSFRMHGPRVLEWTFYNIKLPDSTTNEPASHGFVTFTAKQNKDLADGTEINNRVGIYFDYNDPIITNTTSHIIGRPIKTASWTETKDITDEACDEYDYNNFTYTQTGSYYQIKEGTPTDTLVTLNLTIYNTEDLDLSVSQTVNTLTVAEADATYQWFVCDDTNLPLGGGQSFSPTSSGSYYVIVTKNGCTDASECQSITVLGTIDTSASLNMTRIYPNPNTGSFTVAFGQQLNNANINVADILGKTIYSYNRKWR
jgi:hypothetical protein